MEEKEFVMEDYGRKSEFASFLPGIGGIRGIPCWCYYVNRGQGVVSFGSRNKDGAIMEFYPAHKAYENAKRLGFRTFVRVNGKMVPEPFSDERLSQTMKIRMNSLTVREENPAAGLRTEVRYFILPGERIGALVRKVTLKNITQEVQNIEVLDGMPALVPFGISQENLKNLTETAKAWMQVEELGEEGPADNRKKLIHPLFRTGSSVEDSAEVEITRGSNFAFAVTGAGKELPCIADPKAVFAYDDSFGRAVVWEEEGQEGVLSKKQHFQNVFPCCFFAVSADLQPGESMQIYELIGQVQDTEDLKRYLETPRDAEYFRRKEQEAEQLTADLTSVMTTHTADERFDAYSRYDYMDNALRGGVPVHLGNKVFYVYSRKHGDLERDYNYFTMSAEYLSQGNGNFRDVAQNRRCDVFFDPAVGTENIRRFYTLIQLDGHNPLEVEQLKYRLDADGAEQKVRADLVAAGADEDLTEKAVRENLRGILKKDFTPGTLLMKLEDTCRACGLAGDEPKRKVCDRIFKELMTLSEEGLNASFQEGYWCDHWDYNLDLIEDYLEVFPEKERELLFDASYEFYAPAKKILSYEKRYEKTDRGVRQYHFLEDRVTDSAEVQTGIREGIERDKQGHRVTVTLLEKLVLLSALKTADLDPEGMGVEMDGGKPGWYDALNGLPGMIGSSMAETCELERMLAYTIPVLQKYPAEITLQQETLDFVKAMEKICRINRTDTHAFSFWKERNSLKEIYREIAAEGLSGEKVSVRTEELAEILTTFQAVVQAGIEEAKTYGEGIIPTYFYYEMTEYSETDDGIEPEEFRRHMVPHFLEGPVRYLKTGAMGDQEKVLQDKRNLYQAIRKSSLYDRELSMYKVNESLKGVSPELGRCTAFTPGWLENESIWLHMEYKYLLELLRSGLYEEFFRDFHKAGIPFLNPDVYGRSTLENSSFIASSANPDTDIHGKGFVARLSGSTVEFISMWKRMFFGKNYLRVTQREGQPVLTFSPEPAIPAYLIPEDGRVSARLFGKTDLVYQIRRKGDLIPGNYQLGRITVTWQDGRKTTGSGEISGREAERLRMGEAVKTEVEIL